MLVKKLNRKVIDDEFALISLNATSLFTNIPVDLAIKRLAKKWEHIAKITKIPEKEFLMAVQLILDSTFFTFDNKIYRQKFCTPMGSALSPIMVDLVLEDLENKESLESLGVEPFYVDDIAMTVPYESINKILDIFNSLHTKIQFTLEVSGEKLNFLDVTLTNNNGIIEFDWYHKPVASVLFTHYRKRKA